MASAFSLSNIQWERIIPDMHGDWLNQRDDSYSHFMALDGDKLVRDHSRGLETGRDAWVYGSSAQAVCNSVTRMLKTYAQAVEQDSKDWSFKSNEIKWTSSLISAATKKQKIKFDGAGLRKSIYRPFIPQFVYRGLGLVHRPGHWQSYFPTATVKNLVICVNQGAKEAGQIALMVDRVPDLHFNGDSQCFPRWIYTENSPKGKKSATGDLFVAADATDAPGGYTKTDAITDAALKHFQAAYPGEAITKDDIFYYIYGILHSEDYRTKYANNLMKELPRIPRVATFEQFNAFAEAGRKLADLHVNFESVPEYQGVKISQRNPNAQDKYRVTRMQYGKIPGKTGNAAKDKTVIQYNDNITITGIPLEAQEYVVNKRSALDWILEKARVSQDKDSGIVNDFNDYGMEMTPPNPQYPLSLLLRVITVSLETVKIVKNLPKLEIHPLDQA